MLGKCHAGTVASQGGGLLYPETARGASVELSSSQWVLEWVAGVSWVVRTRLAYARGA